MADISKDTAVELYGLGIVNFSTDKLADFAISELKKTAKNISLNESDRIFMVKLGSEPRGIVASGHAVSGVYESPHWDYEKRASGKMARRIQIDFDKIQDYTCDPIITYESLQQISEAFHWSIQASGVSIPEEIDKKLETLWKNL